jgi:hypothetical protein
MSEASLDLGRFNAMGKQRVVGGRPDVAAVYPAASAAHQVQLPPEPPLGYSVNGLEHPGLPSLSPEAQADPASAALSVDRPDEPRGAGPLSPDEEDTDERHSLRRDPMSVVRMLRSHRRLS